MGLFPSKPLSRRTAMLLGAASMATLASMNLPAAKSKVSLEFDGKRQPIDVTGQPTPAHLLRDCSFVGDGYYSVANWCGRVRCFLDGREVTHLATECDVKLGWVRMHNCDSDGRIVVRGNYPAEFIRFGEVEVMETDLPLARARG